jgi:hypothetical protein
LTASTKLRCAGRARRFRPVLATVQEHVALDGPDTQRVGCVNSIALQIKLF